MGIFLLYNLAGTPFEDFSGTLYLKIWRELLFSSKEGEVYKRGPKPPPLFWEKGAPANLKIPNLPTEFLFGIRYENTEKIPKGSYQNTESLYNSKIYWSKDEHNICVCVLQTEKKKQWRIPISHLCLCVADADRKKMIIP